GLSHVRAKRVSFWRGTRLWRIVDIGPTATVLWQHRATVGDATMSSFTLREKLLAGSILVGVVAAATIAQAVAQQKAAPPDFSSDNAGGGGVNGGCALF